VPLLLTLSHFNLSEVALNTGRPEMGRDEALAVLRTVLPTWRWRPIVLAMLARAHHDLGEAEAAEVVAQEVLRLADSSSPDWKEIFQWLAPLPGIRAADSGRLDSPA
jgi:hypothetical protein